MAANVATTPLPPSSFFCDSASDDEESFVVLGSSLPPSPTGSDSSIAKALADNQPIDGSVIDEAISLVQAHLSTLSDSTSSFPSMPKVSEQDLVSLMDKVHLSTITTHSSVDLSPDEIQQKVDLLVEENIKLKETLHQNNLAMKHQYETLVHWQEDVLKVHQSHKEKFSETKKYIETLKLENARLTEALAMEQSKSKSNEVVPVAANNSPTILMSTNLREFELESAQKKILTLEAEIKVLQNEKLVWDKTSESQNSFKLQVEHLQKELDNCKEVHAQEILWYTKQAQQSDSLQKILLDEIKSLKSKSVDHSKGIIKQEMLNIAQERLDNVQEQLMAAQMHITKLEQLTNQDREMINEKEANIVKLESAILEDKDIINALQAQLELYKSDFETEHQLRNNVTAEKDQIASDLQQLQRRNNQLLEEVERLRGNDFVHVSRLEQAAAAANTAPSAPDDATRWVCPKCNFKFSNYQTLENHVYRCIEIDSIF